MYPSDMIADNMPQLLFNLYYVEVGLFEASPAHPLSMYEAVVASCKLIQENIKTKTEFSFSDSEYKHHTITFTPNENAALFLKVYPRINTLRSMMKGVENLEEFVVSDLFKVVGHYVKEKPELKELIIKEVQRFKEKYGELVYQRMLKSTKEIFEFDLTH